MIEAMWSARFRSNLGYQGDGLVVILNGKVMGGDSGFTYIGNCQVEKGVVTVTLKVKKYANPYGMVSVAGSDDYQLTLSGKVDHDRIILTGHPEGASNVRLDVELNRIEELNWNA